MANTELVLKECEMNHSLSEICEALLTAACLSCPGDPIQFLNNTLMNFYGHDNLQHVDWHQFVADTEYCSLLRRPTHSAYNESDDDTLPFSLVERAFSCYRKNLKRSCFRKWQRFTARSRRHAMEKAMKKNMAIKHYQKKCLQVTFTHWLSWVKLHKRGQVAAIRKLERLVDCHLLTRIMAAWHNVAMESKTRKDYFKKLEMGLLEFGNKLHQVGERFGDISVFPSKLMLKIFQFLELQDWFSCAAVCHVWKALIQSGPLWSQINFSVEKDWITDRKTKQILQSYRPFVTYVNLRGCTALSDLSLKCISECQNLQELNVSECDNVTDAMIQKIVEGCPSLLYLNLSSTLVTNKTLSELSRNCLNLQYLSLAYCNRFTDQGFLYLTTGKGCDNLIHLDLSGCTQMTVTGFQYLSAGCPSLKKVVINDMPTLSDGCVLALLARCCHLSAVSVLDACHLSDVSIKAITDTVTLKAFSTEGNYQLSDMSWKALCRTSTGLKRLHLAECPRMTDGSLRFVATLRNLLYLDISFCNKVTDTGIKFLTEGFLANKLRELNLSHCNLLTDRSAMRIAQRFGKLYRLNMSYCVKLTETSLEWLNSSSISSLDISGWTIHDQGLAAVDGIQLQKLVLSDCAYITDIGIEMLCKNLTDLEHIDVSYCVALSDSAIKAISFYCRCLVTMGMSGCPKMTDMSVKYLSIGSMYLRELDVSGCVHLTDNIIQHLERICPPLCSIKMNCCKSISTQAALSLQPHVKHWEYSNF